MASPIDFETQISLRTYAPQKGPLKNMSPGAYFQNFTISQYADDTTLILDGSEKSLRSAVQILDDFNDTISGLSSKTEALWIGSKIGHEWILVSGKKFKCLKWPKYKVKTLGLWLSTDSDIALRLNYNEKTKTLGSFWVAGNTVDSPKGKLLSLNHWPHQNWFTCQSPLNAQIITL